MVDSTELFYCQTCGPPQKEFIQAGSPNSSWSDKMTFNMAYWHHNAILIWVSIGEGNGLVLKDTTPLHEPVLTYRQRCAMQFTLEQFLKKRAWTQSVSCVRILNFQYYIRSHLPGVDELTDLSLCYKGNLEICDKYGRHYGHVFTGRYIRHHNSMNYILFIFLSTNFGKYHEKNSCASFPWFDSLLTKQTTAAALWQVWGTFMISCWR